MRIIGTSVLQVGPDVDDVVNRHLDTDHLLADLKGRSIKGASVTIISQGVKFILQTASTMILARLLMPSDFGLIAMVALLTSFASLFNDLGLNMATIQRPDINHAQVSTLFWINFFLSCSLAVLVGALAPVIAWFYNEPLLVKITFAFAGTLILSGLTVQHQALLNRQMRFKTLAVINVVSMATGNIVAILMSYLDYGYWSLVGMTIASASANCTLVWLVSGWRPGMPIRRCGIREILAFGWGLSTFNIINYFTRNADNIVVGYALGSGPLGIYSKAYNILLMPIRQINSPLSGVMLSTLSRLQEDPDRYRRYYLGIVRAIALVTMPLVAFLFVRSGQVVLILLGERWIQAATVFKWLAPAAFIGAINFAPGLLCTSLGRANIQVYWAMLSAPISVTGFLVGVHWGVDGVAASFSATWCVLFLVFLHLSCRSSPVRFSQILQALVAPMTCSIAAAVFSNVIYHEIAKPRLPAVIDITICLIIYIVIYVVFCLFFPSGRESLRMLLTFFRKKSIVI